MVAHGRQVHLDRSWLPGLPEPLRTDWTNYDPEGHVDFDCELAFDGQHWTPKLVVHGLGNVSFGCHKFPYRLERATRHDGADGQRA